MKTKDEVRRLIREQKKSYTPEELDALSETIMLTVEESAEFQQARTVAAYWSLPDEVQTHRFIEKWCEKKCILLPVMCEGDTLQLKIYRKGCAMEQMAFGICEPDGEPFPPEKVDLIIVPGMAFDRLNSRLGRGRGFYDRLLVHTPAVKLGICFGFQFFETVPVDTYDIKMDRVIHG